MQHLLEERGFEQVKQQPQGKSLAKCGGVKVRVGRVVMVGVVGGGGEVVSCLVNVVCEFSFP